MFTRNRLSVLTICCLGIFAGSLILPCRGFGQGGGDSFFSQGQSVYDAQNLAKSQQDALQDLLTQAVTQALGSFLSPAQMGGNYAALQAKILKQPERYVQSYQIFSENPAGGLYRVTGQVTIAMDALKKDVRQSGLKPSEGGAAEAVVPAAPAQATAQPEPSAAAEAPAPPAAPQAEAGEVAPQEAVGSEQAILWAVTENWDGTWILPENSAALRNPFAMSVLQESQDYSWVLKFPPSGSLQVDSSGKVSLQQLTALSLPMGIQKAVVGTVLFRRDAAPGSQLNAALQVVDISTGRSNGELRKEMSTSYSSQEDAMQMAYIAVPQLDRMLRESPSAPSSPSVSGASVAPGDEWTLMIHSDYPYANWEELEEILRNRFNSMQVVKLEFGSGMAKAHVRGLGPEFASLLQEGFQMKDGARMQVSGFSPENRSVELSLTRF